MTVQELMLRVKDELEARGFTTVSAKFSNLEDYAFETHAERDNKSEWRPVEGWSSPRLCGVRIEFRVVHRHNGTDTNQSVDIAVYQYKNSSGKRVSQERINTHMGDRAIKTRIDRIVKVFEETEPEYKI